MKPPSAPPTVYVVDDDDAVRDSLTLLLGMHDLQIEAYASAAAFLADWRGRTRNGCLVLDLHMPGMSGLELLRHLRRDGIELPTILMTGRGNEATCSEALQAGAVAVLDKPIDSARLLALLRTSLQDGAE